MLLSRLKVSKPLVLAVLLEVLLPGAHEVEGGLIHLACQVLPAVPAVPAVPAGSPRTVHR